MKITEKDVAESFKNVTFGKLKDSPEIIKLKEYLKVVYDSKLDIELKYAILNRFEDDNTDPEIYETVEEFIDDHVNDNCIVCDLDSCLDAYENISGVEAFDGDEEREGVGTVIRDHFKENVTDFSYTIMTEDYTILIKGDSH